MTIIAMLRKEHAALERLMSELITARTRGRPRVVPAPARSRRYASGCEFIEVLREHFEEEERLLFSWVEKTLPEDELTELSDRAGAVFGE